LKLYDPDDTGAHCTEYHPVSGDAPLHDTDTRPHDSNAPTVNTGATGNDTEVVVVVVVVVDVGTVVVVVVVEVVVVVVVVTPLDELVLRTARHTLSPTKSGVVSSAELRRNNRACGTLNRAARRDHESFGNTRCVDAHCGDGCTRVAGDTTAEAGATTPSRASTTAAPRSRRGRISLLYAKSNNICNNTSH
jgi:hypothetical protein